MSRLIHRFKIEYKSCASDKWVDRSEYAEAPQSEDPYEVASGIACRRMNVTERGIKVTYTGMQIAGNTEDLVTPINPFTVTIERL